jgi:hypothetical protein
MHSQTDAPPPRAAIRAVSDKWQPRWVPLAGTACPEPHATPRCPAAADRHATALQPPSPAPLARLPGAPRQAAPQRAWQQAARALRPVRGWARAALRLGARLLRPLAAAAAAADARLRAWLCARMPALVTGGLVAAVLLGPLLSSLFVAVQVGARTRRCAAWVQSRVWYAAW